MKEKSTYRFQLTKLVERQTNRHTFANGVLPSGRQRRRETSLEAFRTKSNSIVVCLRVKEHGKKKEVTAVLGENGEGKWRSLGGGQAGT